MAIELPRAHGGGGARARRAPIPDAGDVPQARVPSDPGPGRIPAGAFGADVGSGFESAAKGIESFAEDIRKAAERQQKQFDATRTTEAQLDFEKTAMEEFRRRQTQDDPSRPEFLKEFEGWLGQRATEVESRLDKGVSPFAREALRLRLRDKSNGIADAAGRISLQAGQDKALSAVDQLINQWGAQAQRDPDALDAILADTDTALAPFAGALTPKAEAIARAKSRQETILGSVTGLVNQGRYKDAEARLASGQFDADLDQTARDRALATVKRGRAMAAAEVNGLANDHFASISETGQGISGLSAKAVSVMEPDQLADFRAREVRAKKVFEIGNAITFAPPEEVRAQVDRLKPIPGSSTYATDSQLYAAVQSKAQRLLQARIDNPAAYAMQEPSVAQAFQAAQSDPARLPEAIAKSMAMQETMGLPPERRRILANAEGEVARIAALPPEQAANEIEGMANQYGRYWGQAYRELVNAKLPSEYIALSALDGPKDVALRKDLGDALKAGRKTLADTLPVSTPKSDIDKAVGTALEPWARLEATRAGGSRNIAAMRGAAEILAYKYATEGRSDPAGDAVKALVMDRYDLMESGRFLLYVPRGISGSVESTGRRLLDSLKAGQLSDPGGDPKLTADQRKAEYLKQAKRGRFILDETGEGAFLVDVLGQPVMADGQRVGFRFDRLDGPAPLDPNMGISP